MGLSKVNYSDSASIQIYESVIMEVFFLSNRRKVRRLRRQPRVNLGAVAFICIILYIAISFIIYWRKPRISVYEVNEKQISNEYGCSAIALRDETIVTTSDDGYLNYYYADGSRIAKNSPVYTLDQTGEIYSLLSSSTESSTLTRSQRKLLWNDISDFHEAYSYSDYSSVSDFAYDVENTVMEISTTALSENIQKILSEHNLDGTYQTVVASQSGIVSYMVDGYENKSWKDIGAKDFVYANYEKKTLRTSKKVKAGSAAYKITSSDDWTLVIELPEKLYEELQKREQSNKQKNANSYFKLTFTREDISVDVAYELFVKDDQYFAKVDLNRYENQYISDRFIDVKVSLNEVKGLKIPTSSIVSKEFYIVPEEYFTVGGDSGDDGLITEEYNKSGEVEYKFVKTTKYFKDSNNMVYVDKNSFEPGQWIHGNGTKDRYQLSEIRKLKGIYNINLGYCIFKYVKILYKNSEYCIVKDGLTDSISNFDHIIVDAKTVTENDLINNYKG